MMLSIDNLHAYYGKSHVLHGVHFDVGQGEIVALLGRNGSGRSTTAKAIMGMVESSAGLVSVSGQCSRRSHGRPSFRPASRVSASWRTRLSSGSAWATGRRSPMPCDESLPASANESRSRGAGPSSDTSTATAVPMLRTSTRMSPFP